MERVISVLEVKDNSKITETVVTVSGEKNGDNYRHGIHKRVGT